MAALNFIGAMGTIIEDISNILKTDEVLSLYKFFPTEQVIKFTMEQGELENDDLFVEYGVTFPCTTVHLITRKESNESNNCGGLQFDYTTPGRVIFWIEPEGDESIPSLDEIGERIEYKLKQEKEDLFNDYVVEWSFEEAYQSSYDLPVYKTIKTVAFMVIVEFEITYKVVM